MKLLVLLAALLLVGCSVEVAHETEIKSQNESLSTFDKSKTTVALSILESPETETKHTDSQESATTSILQSKTTVKVVVLESTPKVIMTPLPQAPRRPDRMIRVAGIGNTVILGDVHLHHHEHKHYHQAPKPHPVRVDVRVELGDRFNERERRTRMVEARIARFFPHYRD